MLELPWGNARLRLRLPDSWRVLGPYLPAVVQQSAASHADCRLALREPTAAEPLANHDLRGKRVLLVVDDQSRPTPVYQFFPAVREALLQAGAKPADIEILFALGVHRPMTATEAEAKIGKDNLAMHRWHNHDAFDPTQLVHLGITRRGTPIFLNRRLTECDLIVTLGAIEPHLLLGFSGGAKMLLPGCAGAETIGHNHLRGAVHGEFNYVGADTDASPMRLDLEEGVRLLGREVFIVNAVLDRDRRIVSFFCGDSEKAFRAGAEFVRRHAKCSPPESADVVITNSRPFDADLRQGLKCIGNTLFAARPGGVVLGFTYCADGRGDVPIPSWTIPYPVLRPCLKALGQKRILGFVRCLRKHDPIEQRFLAHFGLQMLRRNHIWFYSDRLEPDLGHKFGMLRQYTDVEKMIADTVSKVGTRATVAVFPFGGATYVPAETFG
jgi:nickel-dependent lactate racemase